LTDEIVYIAIFDSDFSITIIQIKTSCADREFSHGKPKKACLFDSGQCTPPHMIYQIGTGGTVITIENVRHIPLPDVWEIFYS
jgi:hypothetical protein